MNRITVRSELEYNVVSDTTFVFSVAAARTDHQSVVSERITIEPPVPHELVAYGEERTHELLRTEAGPGRLTIGYEAVVALDPETEDPAALIECRFGAVPPDVLAYLNPSRYCEADRVVDFANRHFGHVDPGFGRVAAIRDWVEHNIIYVIGSTGPSDSALDGLVQRAGVCRDFAHVTITLCRALGIPARYVSGYGVCVEPADFHGFVEVFLKQGWYLLDPTGIAPPNGLVTTTHGR